MELRQLEYLVAVAEEHNFTRAAARVHVSQSGISAQIRQLERELGAELFDRAGRVTAAGEAALVHARAALASAAAVGQSLGQVTGLLRGRVRVGMVSGCTITPWFDALAAFHRAHPGVQVSLVEDTSDRLVAGVRAGADDLALVGVGSTRPEGLESHTIVSERLVAVVPPGHPLTEAPVRLRDLAEHPVVCMPAGTGLRAVLDQARAAREVHLRIAWQASAADAIADLAARGLGVGILSESMATAYADRLVARRIDDVDAPAVLAVVWRPSAGPAVRELVTHVRAAFG
jgi:DNA-binding transcriptional LysR family regulator